MSDYSNHDPKGWFGDPRRGAAMGRPTIQDGDPGAVTGRMTLRKVKMCSCCGAYDTNGTYFRRDATGTHDAMRWRRSS